MHFDLFRCLYLWQNIKKMENKNEQKDKAIVPIEWLEVANTLGPGESGRLLKALLNYRFYRHIPEKLSPRLQSFYKLLRDKVPESDVLIYDDNRTGFDLFWKLYNKKLNKRLCRDEWLDLEDEQQAEIFERLPEYVDSTTQENRMIPLTYLRGKHWHDLIMKREKSVNLTK